MTSYIARGKVIDSDSGVLAGAKVVAYALVKQASDRLI